MDVRVWKLEFGRVDIRSVSSRIAENGKEGLRLDYYHTSIEHCFCKLANLFI